MCIDLDSILSVANLNFQTISSLQIKGFVKMRRIFTLKQPLGFFDGAGIFDGELVKGKVIMPKNISLPIPTYNLDINLDFIEDSQEGLAVNGKGMGRKRSQDDRSTKIETPNVGPKKTNFKSMGGSRNTNYTMNFGSTKQGRTMNSYNSPQLRKNSKGMGSKLPKYMSQQNARMKQGPSKGRRNSKSRTNTKVQSPFVDEELELANVKHQNFEFEFEVSNTQNTNFQKKMSRTNPYNKPRGNKNGNLTMSAQRSINGRNMIRNKNGKNIKKTPNMNRSPKVPRSRGRNSSIKKDRSYSRGKPQPGFRNKDKLRKNNPFSTGYDPEPYGQAEPELQGFDVGVFDEEDDDDLISIGKL